MKKQLIELLCSRFKQELVSFEELRMSITSILSECYEVEDFYDCLKQAKESLEASY